MNGGTINEVERIFQQLRRMNQADRAAVLDDETAGRPALRAEVESLLSALEEGEAGFLDTPALGAGFPIVLSGDTQSVPDQIGRYRVIEPLGEGGMATVYVAEQEQPRRRVALKLMKTLLGPRAEKRFELEAMVLGRLRHPCIAQIYEAGIHQTEMGRIPYIAMELVEGERLTVLVKQRSLDLRATLQLFCRICDAVQHAHQQGVIHRDLKPSNILVEDRDGRLSPKLLDLGIARATDVDMQATTFETNVGELVGTVQYMSPEQAAGDPDEIDTRSDVYSLGVVLFELLSGKLPYDLRGKPIHEALRSIREDEPLTLRSADASLRGDLDAIVIKALEKEKTRRYQSARELAEDLQRFMRSEPVTARHPSAAYQLRKFARRNRALVLGASFVTVALVLGLIGTTIFAVRESRARKLATEAEASERIQREKADSERALAERRFEEVQHLAMLFVDEVDSRIRQIPGATKAREFIVATGLEYLDKLSQEAGDDDELLVQLSTAYFRLGDIQGFPDSSNLGDRAGAIASYDKGISLLERVRDRHPDDMNVAAGLCVAYGHYGMVLQETDRRDEAGEYFRKSYQMLRKVGDSSQSMDLMMIAAYHENRLGDEARYRSDFDSAASQYRDALAIYLRVLDKMPESSMGRRGVAAASDRMGRLLVKRGENDEAIEHFERFIELTEQVIADEGLRADPSLDLAIGYEQLGLCMRQTARRGEALALFEKSLAIRKRMHEADPDDRRAETHLMLAYSAMGEECQYRGDLSAARSWFVQQLKLGRRLVENSPDDQSLLRRLSTARYKMANVLFQMGSDGESDDSARTARLRESIEYYDRSIEGFSSLVEEGGGDPSDPLVLIQLASERAACNDALDGISERAVVVEQP